MNFITLPLLVLCAVSWEHPAGMITDDTIVELREKIATQPWASNLSESLQRNVAPWVEIESAELRRIFPRTGGNVYHNFSCPKDRVRLRFDPFNPDTFTCETCKTEYPPQTDAGIYEVEDRYHSDMYGGWVCLFHNVLSQQMVDMALLSRMNDDGAMRARGIELLLLYVEVLPTLTLRIPPSIDPDSPMRGQYNRILTYHREGDNTILFNLAQAYELLRDHMNETQRGLVEKHVLARLLNDIMLEPIYVYDHNNVYQWHRTIVQAALALEREDLIDWSFGFGPYSPETLPEHRSMNRILATHFNEDGAFWELASGYHLYPVQHLCEFAVLSRNVSAMDPERFDPTRYDLTRKDSVGGQVIHKALTWFMALAMPDRSMTIVGDSTQSRAGMDDYSATAEIGYRYYDILAVGDYARFREGRRSRHGFLYGAPVIQQHALPFTSSFLSSGWVSLRNEWQGNRVWAGLNALIKGGGHQHADHLTFTLFAHDQLLALEKSVPYNEATLRILGTETAAHNTVTVDYESQPQGEAMTPEQTPEVVYFHDGPLVKYTEVHGDNLYAQTTVYRRSIALVEDIALDLFRVEGGDTHDWMLYHSGTAPNFSIPVSPGTFTPVEWLHGGSETIHHGTTNGMWSAQWPVANVTSRLTMLGASETEIYGLETWPLDNATITDEYPATQTLCVRRHHDAPFLAVWESWEDTPNLVKVTAAANRPDAVCISTAQHVYHVVFGPGRAEFSDGIRIDSNGAFAIMRDADAATMVGGSLLTIHDGDETRTIEADHAATLVVSAGEEGVSTATYNNIMHDTVGGVDKRRESPETQVNVSGF